VANVTFIRNIAALRFSNLISNFLWKLFFKTKCMIFFLIHGFFPHRCTVHFEFYVVCTPGNALFINLVKSFNVH